MKIEIKNLGPINEFTFDLEKDFHIIYGENNIGKSYAISTIYIILKYFIIEPTNIDFNLLRYLIQAEKQDISELSEIITNINTKLSEEKTRTFSITKLCENILKTEISNTYLPLLKQSFKNSFSNLENLQNKLSNEEFYIKLYLDDFQFSIKLSKNKELYIDDLKFSKRMLVKFIKTNQETAIRENDILFFIKITDFDPFKLQQEIIESIFKLAHNSFDILKQSLNQIYFLPASRSGLYQAMNIFSSVFAKLSQIRHAVNSQIDIPALSEPVSDYFLKLSTIKSHKNSDRYTQIAKEIENTILKGEVLFNSETKKIEYFEKNTKLKLDLSETSSMVSEISPIVAYLKFIIDESSTDVSNSGIYGFINQTEKKENFNVKKLLFIEEPEAHLHPNVQVQLVEYFAKLVKNNIKVVLTTHSDYISNKITNLILSKELDYNVVSSYHLMKTNKGSLDKGDMLATIDGIEDNNFLNVAEKLYEERILMSNLENN